MALARASADMRAAKGAISVWASADERGTAGLVDLRRARRRGARDPAPPADRAARSGPRRAPASRAARADPAPAPPLRGGDRRPADRPLGAHRRSAARSRDRGARAGCRASPARRRQRDASTSCVTPTARRQSSNSVEDVGLAELDADRPAPRSFRVVALAVPIDAAEGHGERHALRRPARHLLEDRPDDANQVAFVLSRQSRFRSRGSIRRGLSSADQLRLARSQISRSPSSVRFGIDVLDRGALAGDDVGQPAGRDHDRPVAARRARRACGARARPPSPRSRRTAPTAWR